MICRFLSFVVKITLYSSERTSVLLYINVSYSKIGYFKCESYAEYSSVTVVTRLQDDKPGFSSYQKHGFFSLHHHIQTGFEAY
jgi:hypothetical protein